MSEPGLCGSVQADEMSGRCPGSIPELVKSAFGSAAVICHIELKEKVEASNGHGNRRT